MQSPVASEGAVDSICSQESYWLWSRAKVVGEAAVSLFWQPAERTLRTSTFWMK